MYEFSSGTSSTSLEAGLEPNILFLGVTSLYVSRQSRWILKRHCNADFEVKAKRIQHSVHSIKYLEAFMPNNGHNAQNKRCRQYLQRNRPKGVRTRHFHNMARKQCDRWARRNDCLPPLPQWRSVVRPKLPKERD
jgi:hypothetical protein